MTWGVRADGAGTGPADGPAGRPADGGGDPRPDGGGDADGDADGGADLGADVDGDGDGDGDELGIGELAARFGLAAHVLRHWEEKGLLTPARRVAGRRRYGRRHLADVAVILLGKEGGLSLDQVRVLLTEVDGESRREVFRRQLAELDRRIAAAQASRDLLAHALGCGAEDIRRCPSFLRKVADRIPEGQAAPGPGARARRDGRASGARGRGA